MHGKHLERQPALRRRADSVRLQTPHPTHTRVRTPTHPRTDARSCTHTQLGARARTVANARARARARELLLAAHRRAFTTLTAERTLYVHTEGICIALCNAHILFSVYESNATMHNVLTHRVLCALHAHYLRIIISIMIYYIIHIYFFLL